jgi:lipopolysaccharide/colanic/teichoic acid biosynthesis glycosyltransferase
VKQLQESLTGRVELEHLSENNFGSLIPAYAYFQVKHLVDWIVAIIAILILAPLLLIAAIAIRVDSAGSPIFRQRRVGYGGVVFTVYKFRTMLSPRSDDIADRSAAQTQHNDQRITRLGKFLRKTRSDELPQIINILRGEMSWIGPRPEAEVLSNWYEHEIAFYRYRHIVRPGITGWAQVNQGHVVDVDDVRSKLHYDFYYIKNFSPWIDLLIVAKTIQTVLTGFGHR